MTGNLSIKNGRYTYKLIEFLLNPLDGTCTLLKAYVCWKRSPVCISELFATRARAIRLGRTAACRHTVQPWILLSLILNGPPSAARCLNVHTTRETLVAKGGTSWARSAPIISSNMSNLMLYVGVFYMPENLRHGAGWLYFPLRRKACWGFFFSPWNIRRLLSGFNPRTWVLKASTLTRRPPKMTSGNF
jgi:hypothetical protein